MIVFDGLECLPVMAGTMRLSIRNVSNQDIGFYLSAFDKSGYQLHPGYFDLLADAGDDDPGIWNAVLDHYVAPQQIARLEPGDVAVFDVDSSIWPTSQDTGRFIVQVRDTRWRAHRSGSIRVCDNTRHTAASAIIR